jgi:hypothetical protein
MGMFMPTMGLVLRIFGRAHDCLWVVLLVVVGSLLRVGVVGPDVKNTAPQFVFNKYF